MFFVDFPFHLCPTLEKMYNSLYFFFLKVSYGQCYDDCPFMKIYNCSSLIITIPFSYICCIFIQKIFLCVQYCKWSLCAFFSMLRWLSFKKKKKQKYIPLSYKFFFCRFVILQKLLYDLHSIICHDDIN